MTINAIGICQDNSISHPGLKEFLALIDEEVF